MTTRISKVILALILTICSFVLVKVPATTYAADTKSNSIVNISDELSHQKTLVESYRISNPKGTSEELFNETYLPLALDFFNHSMGLCEITNQLAIRRQAFYKQYDMVTMISDVFEKEKEVYNTISDFGNSIITHHWVMGSKLVQENCKKISELIKSVDIDFHEIYNTPSEINLPVKTSGQSTAYTCGAESCSIVLRFVTGQELTDTEIFEFENLYGEGTYVYRQVDALRHYGISGYTYKDMSGSNIDQYYKDIFASLKNNMPVIMVLNIPDNELSSKLGYRSSGHYLVVNAIRKTATGSGYEVDVVDPWIGCVNDHGQSAKHIDLDLLINANKAHSGFIILNK